LLFGFLGRDSVSPLDARNQTLLLTGNGLPVTVGEPAPVRARRTYKVFPPSFELIPIQICFSFRVLLVSILHPIDYLGAVYLLYRMRFRPIGGLTVVHHSRVV